MKIQGIRINQYKVTLWLVTLDPPLSLWVGRRWTKMREVVLLITITFETEKNLKYSISICFYVQQHNWHVNDARDTVPVFTSSQSQSPKKWDRRKRHMLKISSVRAMLNKEGVGEGIQKKLREAREGFMEEMDSRRKDDQIQEMSWSSLGILETSWPG